MPFIPSGTLKDQLGKPIPFREAARTLAPLARALAYAHGEDIIHRDVKPPNILITQSGHPVLTDFGVAKLLEEVDGNTLTGTGMGLGTPEYMAPEQWQGKADARSDQYALGVIFYEMVTGQKPFTADTPIAIMLKQLNEPLPNLRQFSADLPEEVEFSVLKMMAKDPENRYPDMNAVATMLEKLANQQLPIPEHTGYFEEDPDEEDEQTRYDRTSNIERISEIWPEKELGNVEPDVFSDDTIDQVDMGEENPDSEKKRPVDPQSIENSYKVQKSIAKRVGKWMLIVVLIFAFGRMYLELAGILKPIITNQNPKTASVLTENDQVVLLETSIPITTAQTTKTPKNTQTQTQMFTSPPTNQIGSLMVSEKDGMELIYIPEGNFILGDEEINENPYRNKNLNAFWIDRTEITNQQYYKCYDSGVCSRPKDIERFSGSGYNTTEYEIKSSYTFFEHQKNLPVWNVDFEQAEIYCNWAGRRLPTDEEWEKAARGENGNFFVWGNDDNKSIFSTTSYLREVGHFDLDTSYFDVKDLQLNVREWTAEGNIRGGYFSGFHKWDLVEFQEQFKTTNSYIGFRCALSE